MRSLLSPILFQEVFGHADIDEIPWKKLIHGAFPHGVKLNIHSGICKCLHPFFIVKLSLQESYRHPRRYASSITFPTLRSPRANTPSSTVTSASCQLYFKLFLFNCCKIHALQSLHGECILHLETSVPTGTG